MKKTLLLGITILMAGYMHAQIFDNYGIRAGVGIANQYVDSKDKTFYSSYWHDNKAGLSFYLNAEKQFNKFISLRPEIGYAQKGYKSSITLTSAEGTIASVDNEAVKLNNLSINFSGIITPLNTEIKPYIVLGVRSDLLLSYEDIEVGGIGIYQGFLDNYNKIVLGGQFGLGIDYKDKFYFEAIYNPAFTKSYDGSFMSIQDRFIEFTVGVNINKLFGGK